MSAHETVVPILGGYRRGSAGTSIWRKGLAMSTRKQHSFTEVTLSTAIARRTRVHVELPPIASRAELSALSSFLGMAEPEAVVLSVPITDRGEKVFIPDGTAVKINFGLDDMCFAAEVTVLRHVMFPVTPTRREDALAISRPVRLTTSNRRQHPRYTVDPSRVIAATVWKAEDLSDLTPDPEKAVGRLRDWSEVGLGVALRSRCTADEGQWCVIALDLPDTGERQFLWGILRHCTTGDGEEWSAGFSDIKGIRAGEAVSLMELLAGSSVSKSGAD